MIIDELSLRDLLAIASVAQHRHFGKAAASLRIAQPTLSAQVAKAERALGSPLFERTGRSFLITPEGECLLPLIRAVIAAADLLQAAADLTAGPAESAQPFKLGVIPTLGPYLMPHLLPSLQRAPKGQSAARRALPPIEIAEAPTAQLIEALRAGTLDGALLSLPIRQEALSIIPLFDEPFRLIAPHNSPLLESTRLAPARLRASDMVLLEEGHCLRDQALALCGKRGGTTPKLVTTSLETLKYLVASNNAGYSLLPALACSLPEGLSQLVKIRSFDERPPARRIALCHRRTSPRAAQANALAQAICDCVPSAVRLVA